MLLKENGKIIEIRICDEEPSAMQRELGVKPGVFPETIVAKRRNKGGEIEKVEYVRKS